VLGAVAGLVQHGAMLKFSANLGMLFTELPFLERFGAARQAGFAGVEYPFPYAHAIERLQTQLQAARLAQVLLNLPPGNWDQGERGIACLPERRSEFQDGVGRGLEYARALGCSMLNCLAGSAQGIDPERARETLVDNLRFAARELAAAGIRLLMEPINTRDMPGFFLCHSEQALALCEAVGSPNLWIQYDVYHMQVMEGDLAHGIDKCWSRIAHFQVADNPGRHEPGSGEIAYPFLLRRIEQRGYTGWIGCEYHPRTSTLAGLAWLDAFR
jgi:hydroxypyruvate isomerase